MFTRRLMSTHKWIILLTTLYYHVGYTQEDTNGCFKKLTLDDMESHELTSPDVTVTPRNTSCTWQIDVRGYQDNKTITLAFDTDIGDNCSTDHVKVLSNSSVADVHQELVVLCGQRQKQYEFFIDSIFIIFKASADHTQRSQTFRLVYRLQNVSSCSRTLHGSEGWITSPGYQDPYLSFQRCTYLFEAKSIDYVMQLDFEFIAVSDSCTHEYLLVYGGNAENGHFVGRYCGYQLQRPKFREFYKSLLVVFVSRDNRVGRRGFKARYREVKCGGNLDVRTHESKLRFPGYTYPFTHNIRCSWLLISGYELHKILLTFNGDNFDCSRTAITVHDEKRRNRTDPTFCDHNQQMYLSSGPKVTVSLANAMENTVSFVMHFKSELIPACGEERLELTSYEYAQTLESPEYPIRYPDYLNCVWVIRSASKENKIKFTVEEIDLESSCNDKLLFYNGDIHDWSKQSEKYYCGHYSGVPTAPFVSDERTVTVRFFSNAGNVGKGFRLYYQSVSTDIYVTPVPTRTTNTGVFIGVVVSVTVVVVVIVIAMVIVIKKRRSTPEPQSSNHVYTHSRDQSIPSLVGMRGSISAPPPSYQEVSTHPRDENGTPDRGPSDTSVTPPAYPRDENGGLNSDQSNTSANTSAPPADASLPPTYSEAMLNNMIQVEWF